MKTRSGKLVLHNEYNSSMLFFPKTDDERKKASYSWANEDYRQRHVDSSIEGAISKPEEYIPFYFRHLSATIVGAWSWKATEFSELVLKAAAMKLRHKPCYVNHELEVANIVGVNGDIAYVGKAKAADGTIIPGGLEGPIWFDGRVQKDLCRQLSGYPVPHIQSVSVTVTYNWVPSHEFTDREGQEDEWEFERKIGTIVEGRMVRRVVTEIIDFYETSLVFLGADPYAKILGTDGKPINIEKDAIVGTKQFDADPLCGRYKDDNLMFVSDTGMKAENILHLKKSVHANFSKTGNFVQNREINNNQNSFEMSLQAKLASKLNKTEAEINEEILDQYTFVTKEEFERFKKAETDLVTVNKTAGEQKTELDSAKTTLEAYEKICKPDALDALSKDIALEEVVSLSKFGKTVLNAKREETVKYYKLFVGEGKEVQAVIDTINKADEAALDGLLKQYGASVTDTFGATCTSCNSAEHISYRSSQPEGDGGVKKETGDPSESRMAHRYRG